MSSSFSIEVYDLHWKGDVVPALDYCAHGSIYVQIGDEVVCAREEYSEWAVNVTALYLIRTLERDHLMDSNPEVKLIQKCGHAFVTNKDTDEILFASCPKWLDWSVTHVDDMVKLCTAKGTEALIPFAEYKDAVLAFSDKVAAFYKADNCFKLPYNDSWTNFKRYIDEWHTLRQKWGE